MWQDYACPHFGSKDNLLATCGHAQDDPFPARAACTPGPDWPPQARWAHATAACPQTRPRAQPHQPARTGRAPRGRRRVFLDLPGMWSEPRPERQHPHAPTRKDWHGNPSTALDSAASSKPRTGPSHGSARTYTHTSRGYSTTGAGFTRSCACSALRG